MCRHHVYVEIITGQRAHVQRGLRQQALEEVRHGSRRPVRASRLVLTVLLYVLVAFCVYVLHVLVSLRLYFVCFSIPEGPRSSTI